MRAGGGTGTLVISDLHLGERSGRDLLRRPDVLAALLTGLGGVRRLVVLGDLLELRQGPRASALAAAEATLRAIGAALEPGARVTLVPGNHDHGLLTPWRQRRADVVASPALGLQTTVDWRDGEPLARLAQWLAPAALEVVYPGVWLRDDVYALHGHYADRHTTVPQLERLGAGVMARVAGERAAGPRRAEDYEATLAPMYDWIDALAQGEGGRGAGRAAGGAGASARAWRALAGGDGGGRRGLRPRLAVGAFALAIAGLNRAGIGPLSADLSRDALRDAALRAVGEVALRLGADDARHVIFGHTHRAGPLAGDDRSAWRTVTGARLTNCGCWIDEPSFAGRDRARSPYRAGFAVTLAADGPAPAPLLVNLLDGRA